VTTIDWKAGAAPYKLGKMRCLKTTTKAILVEGPLRDGQVGELWIPKSVLHTANKVKKKDQSGEVVVQTWWGEKNL
jgi:hypothetical protein